MLKGFTHARLSCGCRLAFREGSVGSPVLVMLEAKASGPCTDAPEGRRDACAPARHGLHWWEFDPTCDVITLMSAAGLA